MGEESSYRQFDHTGDLGLLVRAGSLAALFDGAVLALFDVILDTRTVLPSRTVPIEIEGAVDLPDLLVRLLSEVLFLHDARGFVFRGFRVDRLEEGRVAGAALGETFEPARHAILRQVKAVTYHQLLVREDRDGWSARLVLDL